MQKLSTVGLYEFLHYSLSFPRVPVFCTFPHMLPDHIWFTGLLCISKLVGDPVRPTYPDRLQHYSVKGHMPSASLVKCQWILATRENNNPGKSRPPLETLSISRCLNHGARCAWAMAVHHAVGISHQRNSGYRQSRVNIMAQGLSTPDPSLSPTHLSIRRGRATIH